MSIQSISNYAKMTNNLRKSDKHTYNVFIDFNHAVNMNNFNLVNMILEQKVLKEEHIGCIINRLSCSKKEGLDKMLSYLKFYQLSI